MARVLVTGGAGYVGSHACKALAEAGHEPVVFDNFRTGHPGAVQFGPLVEGDLLDAEALEAAFREHAPQAVLHFAALSDVGESVRMPGAYWRNNLVGTLNLCEAAMAHGVDKLVFSSTCAIFGEMHGAALTEDAPGLPVNVYGQTKLAVEQMLAGLGAAHGLHSVAFRYFNAAGADPSARIGEDHRPETHLIPLVLDAADGRRDGITVFGADYPTPDGTCIRDYIHVCDLAEAHVLGLDWLLQDGSSLALNLGSGTGHSVRQVIETAREVTGREIAVTEGERRPGDAARLVSGSSRATEILGWRPQRSGLAAMISDAWGWHRTGKYDS